MTKSEIILAKITNNRSKVDPSSDYARVSVKFCLKFGQEIAVKFAEWKDKKSYLYSHNTFCLYGDTRFFTQEQLFEQFNNQSK